MRRTVLSAVVVLAVAINLSAQTTAVPDQLMISHGGLNYILRISQDAFYLGDPAVNVQAEAATGSTLRVSRFAVRAWREGDHIRAVVFAIVPDPQVPTKTLDAIIATYSIKDSAGVRLTETAEWGAAPMTLRPVRLLRR
jgi:hypothetical protein